MAAPSLRYACNQMEPFDMTTQNKRPSVKGKKKIGSLDSGRDSAGESKRPSLFPKRASLLRAKEESADSDALSQGLDPSAGADAGNFGAASAALDAEGLSSELDSAGKTGRPSVGGKGRRSAPSDKKRLAALPSSAGKWGKKGLACIAGVVGIVLAVGIFFVWNTYFRYDDAQDIKGEWLVSGGTVVVAIDAQNIRMPGNVSYSYTLDDQKKRITFTFSELSGGGDYDFSHGRKVLTVSEGNDGSAGVTTFVKISDNAKAKPRIVSEKESQKYMNELAPQSLLAASDEGASDGAAEKKSGSSGKAGEKQASPSQKES